MTSTTEHLDTPAKIVEAALHFNADYPEAEAEILAGTPVLHVTVSYGDRQQSGRIFKACSTFGVTLADGGFAASEDPSVEIIRPRDGRVGPMPEADRRYRRLAADSGVELRLIDRRR